LDGTKVAANAAGDQTYHMEALQRLLARTDTAIGDLRLKTKEAVTRRRPGSRWSFIELRLFGSASSML